MTKENVLVFFGEHAFYLNEKEEEEAKTYLQYWKNNLLQKLQKDTCSAELIEESYHVREPYLSGVFCQRHTLALKIAVKIKFVFSIDQCLGVHYG